MIDETSEELFSRIESNLFEKEFILQVDKEYDDDQQLSAAAETSAAPVVDFMQLKNSLNAVSSQFDTFGNVQWCVNRILFVSAEDFISCAVLTFD
jgi:hypothetical protein